MVSAAVPLEPQYQAPSLSFSVTPSSSHSHARSGTLVFMPATIDTEGEHQAAPRVIETPASLAYSRKGALPHLTRDNVARLPNEMVHLSLEHFMDSAQPTFTKAPFSLHRYVGLQQTSKQKQQLLAMGLRDPVDDRPVPQPTDAFLVANAFQGAVKVSPQVFLEATLPRPPDMLFAFGDDAAGQPTAKRLEKSVRRSLTWVAEVADVAKERTNVFAPLVGSHSLDARTQYSKALRGEITSRATTAAIRNLGELPIDDSISGYTLSIPSTKSGGPTTSELFAASLAPLPSSKPRVVLAAAGPHEILRLVKDVGLDLFVDIWSSYCATVGVGLDFTFPVASFDSPSASAPPPPLPSGKRDIGHSFFDLHFDRSFVPLSSSALADIAEGAEHPFGPEPPSRAYVHHLLQAHEMTSHVILALHNNLVMQAFFASIRNLLALGDESFEKEVERFAETYGEAEADGMYPCVRSAKGEWERVDKERGKGSLKEKLRLDEVEAEMMEGKEQMAVTEGGLKVPLEA